MTYRKSLYLCKLVSFLHLDAGQGCEFAVLVIIECN